jgi:pyruvate dehydrogenase E1 component alpha subunit
VAVTRARRGAGPTLIEAKTYRFDEHNVNLHTGQSKPYRSPDEVAYHTSERDPIKLYRQVLLAESLQQAQLNAIEEDVERSVAEAIKFAEDSPLPDPATLYEYLYTKPVHATVAGQGAS